MGLGGRQADLLDRLPKLQALHKRPAWMPDFRGNSFVSIGHDGSGLSYHEHGQVKAKKPRPPLC